MLPLLLLLLGATCLVHGAPQGDYEVPKNIQNGVTYFNANLNKLFYNDLQAEKNFIYSPLSIYTALLLLYLAANGETKKELSLALQQSSNEQNSEQFIQSLKQFLENLQKNEDVEVSLANGIFLQNNLPIKDSYVKTVKQQLNGESKQLDFVKDGAKAADIVNQWISDKTKSRIPKLFPEPFSPQTRILLANVVYFSATWSDKFSELNTKSENFNTGVKNILVPTLSNKKSIPYVNNQNLQFEAIALPYVSNEFSLGVILPYVNQSLSSLVEQLKPEDYQQLFDDFSKSSPYVDYKIPKFKLNKKESLNSYLQKIGLKGVFVNADLGNLSEEKNLAVSDVAHAAEIEIHENGTVASAATVLQIVKYSLPFNYYNPIPFYVNRPFLFFIYQPKSSVILFSGAVQNPLEG